MNNNKDIDALLDDLLKKEITADQLMDLFEDDPEIDLSAEIDLHFAAAKAVQRYNIVTQVKSVHSNFLNETNTQSTATIKTITTVRHSSTVKWTMRIAASFLLLIGSWLVFQYTTNSSNELYSKIYQPYDLTTDRGISDITTHTMVRDFKNRDFQAVIKIYERLTVSNSREKFLAAYAYLETGNFGKAIDLLNDLLKFNQANKLRLYNDEAEYYLGLSYLKVQKFEEAEAVFKKIQENPNHTFHDKISKWTLRRIHWLN
jgi:tetratricopeptide (TPR) repeat protein